MLREWCQCAANRSLLRLWLGGGGELFVRLLFRDSYSQQCGFQAICGIGVHDLWLAAGGVDRLFSFFLGKGTEQSDQRRSRTMRGRSNRSQGVFECIHGFVLAVPALDAFSHSDSFPAVVESASSVHRQLCLDCATEINAHSEGDAGDSNDYVGQLFLEVCAIYFPHCLSSL